LIPKDLLTDTNSSINTYIMNFLSIDCSTDVGSLFIKTKNKTFIQVLQSDKSNNDLLMKRILDFFKENNIKFDDISNIFVNQGPGNFSGLRGSLSIAKGVSLAKNLNLFGYDTFIWSCAKFFNKKDSVFSIIKFRKKYYLKKFDKNLKDSSKFLEISADKLVQKYKNSFIVTPKNMINHFDKEVLKLANLNLVDLDHNELEFLQLKGLLNKELIRPIYLS